MLYNQPMFQPFYFLGVNKFLVIATTVLYQIRAIYIAREKRVNYLRFQTKTENIYYNVNTIKMI